MVNVKKRVELEAKGRGHQDREGGWLGRPPFTREHLSRRVKEVKEQAVCVYGSRVLQGWVHRAGTCLAGRPAR